MLRPVLAAILLAAVPALVHAQSATAPLVVTATVVSTCQVDVPRSAAISAFATMPVAVTCARGSVVAQVQRPIAPYRRDVRDALVLIDF